MNRAGCDAVIMEVITLQGRLSFNTAGQREFTCYTDFIALSDAALLEWTWSCVRRHDKVVQRELAVAYPHIFLSEPEKYKKLSFLNATLENAWPSSLTLPLPSHKNNGMAQ